MTGNAFDYGGVEGLEPVLTAEIDLIVLIAEGSAAGLGFANRNKKENGEGGGGYQPNPFAVRF